MRIIPGSLPLRANVSKNFLSALRLATGIAAFAYVVWHLSTLPMTEVALWKVSFFSSPWSIMILLGCLALVVVNWGLETAKWKLLAEKIEPVTFTDAYKSILFGISMGMITPKRTGEFAGRIMILAPGNQLQGMLLNTAASMSQLFTTLIMGSLGLLFFLQQGYWLDRESSFTGAYLLIPGMGLSALILLTIYAIPGIRFRFSGNNIVSLALNRCMEAFASISPRNTSTLLLLSFLRYAVFMLQFYLLLYILGLNIQPEVFLALASLKYLMLTLFPLSAIWELGVRGSVALFVFGLYLPAGTPWAASVLAASTGIWVINLALPAIAGSILSLGHDFQNKNKS